MFIFEKISATICEIIFLSSISLFWYIWCFKNDNDKSLWANDTYKVWKKKIKVKEFRASLEKKNYFCFSQKIELSVFLHRIYLYLGISPVNIGRGWDKNYI